MSEASPIQQIKANMRATWMDGDFGVIASKVGHMAGEPFVQRLSIAAGASVLDVATGTGNVAIPLAKAGYRVTGVDIAPNLIEQARARATAAGLTIKFDEGDAEALPYGDGGFDAVVTMFGAMFAPRPKVVAAEFARVLKPGGLLAMGNWNPAGFTGLMFRTTSGHVPPPPGVPAPVLWGDDATVRERLADDFTDLATEIVPLDFDLPMSPAAVVQLFRTYFGPNKRAFERLDEAGQAALAADLQRVWETANLSGDPNRTLVHNEYLLVTARRA